MLRTPVDFQFVIFLLLKANETTLHSDQIILLKIIEKASIKTNSYFIFSYIIFFSFFSNSFLTAEISLSFFLVLLSMPVTSIAIC